MRKMLLLCFLMAVCGYCYSQNCNAPLRIVVLGSSTAWGNQLPNRDSAWVFRYQRYLKQNHNSADTIINLAQGGFTTQEIMPTGTPAYTVNGLTFSVNTSYNINRAIALQPHAIIINMPTNDEARGFALSRQTSNWLALKQYAAQNNIPLWVTTTQPRSNLGFAAAGRLRQMRDTINKYFGPKSVDFWTGLADANGYILAAYNSGDDVHFNAAGHRILADRVRLENIPDTLCGDTTEPEPEPECTDPLRIIVLGSSTAWGNGLPNRDSAWIFRYQRYLKQNHNSADTIINLAKGELVSHSILATGTPDYTVNGVTFTVDATSNITRALALQPDAIIINMANSDEGRGIPLARQTSNFLALKQYAAQNNIPLWVATTQPRNNLGTAAAGRLRQMRDTINKYFGSKAIDFWTGLADANGYILPAYNSGDGWHFNAAGHRILFERVRGENIPDTLCASASLQRLQPTFTMAQAFKETSRTGPGLQLYPNPAWDVIYINGLSGRPYHIEVFNSNGLPVYRQLNLVNNRLRVDGWPTGLYFIVINHGQYRLKLVKL
jgi:lysophospholipase L1-like esterase